MRMLLVIVVFGCLFPVALQGQIRLVKGGAFPPPNSLDSIVHLDTLQHKVYFRYSVGPRRYKDSREPGKRIQREGFFCDSIKDVVVHGQWIFLDRNGRGWVYSYPVWLLGWCDDYYIGEAIVEIWDKYSTQFFDLDNNCMVRHFKFPSCDSINRYPFRLQGMDAFCVPLTVFGDGTWTTCDEARSWGVLGSNGQWLVEPKFDAPFRFHEGVAEVLQYGQKRKINEKGEFVE